MNVVVNGETRALEPPVSIEDVVRSFGAGAELGVAVALNGEVVRKNDWAEATLEEGDRIEVLRAIGGG